MTDRHNTEAKPERTAFAMQGGGAIGAFQAGILETLHEANVTIDACCGSSIGVINAAIFFGNPPSCRVDRLKAFYHSVSAPGTTLIVQIDYAASQRGSHFKDAQFSPAAIQTHWVHGQEAAKAALKRMNEQDRH